MNRPCVSLVAAYAAGLLLARYLPCPLTALYAACFATILLALTVKKIRPLLLWPALILAGWVNLATHTAVLSPNDLRTLVGTETKMAFIHGQLLETPRLRIIEADGKEIWRSLARIRVDSLSDGLTNLPAHGDILATTTGILGTNYFSGQNVEVAGVIQPPPLPLAEGLFNYRAYLANLGVYYELKTKDTNDWSVALPIMAKPPLGDRFLTWSHQTLAIGLPIEDQSQRLIWALALDWRTAFTGDVSDPFLRAGTFHLFAVDGLRIGLLSGMIVTLLRAFRLTRAWCGLIAIPLIWFYTDATGLQSSAIRASVMMTVVLGSWALRRPGDLLNSLAAAAFIILLWDPRQLFEAGFQLSFCVMLVIALLLPPLNDLFDRWLRFDPLIPDDLIPAWKKFLLRAARMILRYFGLSLAAWLGSIPLSAYYFHLFSPVSTLANVFAVPLGTFALMANLGALLCGTCLPWATAWLNNAAWAAMNLMTSVSAEFTRLPGAYFYVPAPSVFSVILYYAVIVAAFSGWFKTMRRKIAGLTALLLIAVVYLCRWELSRGETDLTVLPLDGGHAIYVDAAGRANDWLINTGNRDAAQLTLRDYLRAQGVNRIPHLVLAEASARNCSGAEILSTNFPVDELDTASGRFHSIEYRLTVDVLEHQISRHDSWSAGTNAGYWQVLYPDDTTGIARAEDRPLVLMGHINGTRILLLSDLSRASQSDLLSRTNELHADIVIAGLPDEGEPLCDVLIKAIQPQTIIIADSDFPANRRASDALKERFAATKISVVYTREAGAVKVIFEDGKWRMVGARPQNE